MIAQAFMPFLQKLQSLCEENGVEIVFVRMGRAKGMDGVVLNEHFSAELSKVIPFASTPPVPEEGK